MSSRGKVLLRRHVHPSNFQESTFPIDGSEDTAFSDLQCVWKSVDELKVGLERTEKKLEKIGKEPWNALSDIRGLSGNSKKAQVQSSVNVSSRYKPSSNANAVRIDKPVGLKPSPSQLSLLSSEGVAAKKARRSSPTNAGSSRSANYEEDELGREGELNGDDDEPIRYINCPVPSSALVHHDQGSKADPLVDIPARSARSAEDLKLPLDAIRSSPVSGEAMAGQEVPPFLPVEHKVVIRVSRSMEDASWINRNRNAASRKNHSRSRTGLTQQSHHSTRSANVDRGGREREVVVRESVSWPEIHRRDGLEKLREIVEKQQQELAASVYQPAPAPTVRTIHYSEDVVVPNEENGQTSGFQRIMVRKVAAAPPVSSYPGFSTSEPGSTRKKPALEIVPEKKKKLNNEGDAKTSVTSARRLAKSDWPPKVKKVAKITGNLQDYIICPSSWRKGQELVLRELGKFKPDLGKDKTEEDVSDIEQATAPSTAANDVPSKTSTSTESPKKAVDSTYRVIRNIAEKDGVLPADDPSPPSPKEPTTDSADKSDLVPTRDFLNGLTKPSKDANPRAASTAVSQESSLDEDSQGAEKNYESSPQKVSAFKRVVPSSKPQLPSNKKLKQSTAEPAKSQPKVRHYDADVVRSYISKQRKERMIRLQEEKQKKQRQMQEKQQKLQELQQLQKKLAQSKGSKPVQSAPVLPDDGRNSAEADLMKFQPLPEENSMPPQSDTARHHRKGRTSNDKRNHHQLAPPAIFETIEGQRQTTSSRTPVDRTTNNSEPGLSSTSSSLENERVSPENNADSANAGPSMSTTTFASSVSSSQDERETDIDKVSTESPTADILFPKKASLRELAATCEKEMDVMMARLQPYLNGRGRELAPSDELVGTRHNAHSNDAAAKVERIEMLRAAAESLQQRITEETALITHSHYIRSNNSHAVSSKIFDVRPSDMPSSYLEYHGMPASGQGEAPERVSKSSRQVEDYGIQNERIVRSKNQFSVFEGKLPGVTSLVKHAQMVAENQRRNGAATKIQSWFRGHRIRRSLKWRLPSGRSLGSRLGTFHQSVSTSSELSGRLNGGGTKEQLNAAESKHEESLLRTEFCAGQNTSRTIAVLPPPDLQANLSRALLLSNSSSAHRPDPYNFINTLNRKLQQQRVDYWIPLSPTKPTSPTPERPKTRELLLVSNIGTSVQNEGPSPEYADDFESSMKSMQSKPPSRVVPVGAESHEYKSTSTINSLSDLDSLPVHSLSKSMEKKVESLSHGSQGKDSSGKGASFQASTPLDNAVSHHITTGNEPRSVAGIPKFSNDVQDEILSEGTLSEGVVSFDAESLLTHMSSRTSSPAPNEDEIKTKTTAVKKPSVSIAEGSALASGTHSAVSISATHSTLKSENMLQDARPSVMLHGLHFSPSTLRLRMSTELNYLDSLEESLRQVTTVERVQALALARQETVSLAQALQNEQQKKFVEAELANQASRRSAEEHQRTLAEAQKMHEEVLAAATQSINQVRNEAHSAINSTAHKLLESQAEAAKATAEAARQLAEANVATLGYTKSVDSQDLTKLASATAASAAIAAVNSALRKLHRRASRQRESSVSHSPTASSSGDSISYTAGSRKYSLRYRSSKSASKSEDKHNVPASTHSGSDATIPEELSVHEQEFYTAASYKQTWEQENASPPSASSRSPASVPSTSRETSPGGIDEPTMSEGSLPEIIEEEYSDKFEETVTEEEAEEQFFRKILPSESHRLQSLGKRRRPDGSFSDTKSQSSHEMANSEGGEEHSSQLFSSEDSFNKFTMQMVHQYMKEEELRAKHQMALLELRDKSLVEKTKAEMAWLELQKQQLRDKGQDDKMPPLRKRQRGLMLRLEQEQAEIRRLREAHLVASKERQILLQQQQQIARLRHSTRQILGKIQKAAPGAPPPSLKSLPVNLTSASKSVDSSPKLIGSRRQHLSSSEAGATEEELSVAVDGSKSNEVEEELFARSESEILSYVQCERVQSDVDEEATYSKPNANLQVMKGLKKMQSNRRNLTSREKLLLQRRKDVEEELQSWQKKLETEEQKVDAMEEKVLHLQTTEEKSSMKEQMTAKNHQEQQVQVDWDDVLLLENAAKTNSVKDDTIKEQIPQDESSSLKTRSVMTEDIPSAIKTATETHSTVPEDSKMVVTQTGSNTSEVEEELSSPDRRKSEAADMSADLNKSSPESPIETKSVGSGDYSSSFESPTPGMAVQQKASDCRSGASGPSNERQSAPVSLTLRLPLSPRIHSHKRRDSSGSEDSFTVSQSGAETASDLSDIEGRIHALKEELRRRKIEAERLRKEQKRRSKERLKAQEASLLKQIEAYDCFIRQTKAELERELEVEMQPKVSVKPQIRQPKVAESRHLPHKLQSSVGSVSPGAGGDSSADESGSPQANLSLVSPRPMLREEPIGSPSEQLSASSKKSSLDSIDESIEKSLSLSPTKEAEVENLTSAKKVLEIDDLKGESDNDDSTSDSVRTVTEVGDLPSQKSHSVEKVVAVNTHEEGKVLDKEEVARASQVEVTRDSVSGLLNEETLPKSQTKSVPTPGIDKEALSRQSTLSDIVEELSLQEETKSEGFSPVLSLKDLDQEVVSSPDKKLKSESEKGSQTVQNEMPPIEESVKSKKSLSERPHLLHHMSSEDDTVAEEIEEEMVEEEDLTAAADKFIDSIVAKGMMPTQKTAEEQDDQDTQEPIMEKDTNEGIVKSAEIMVEVLPKDDAKAADKVEVVGNHLFSLLFKDSLAAILTIMKKKHVKKDEGKPANSGDFTVSTDSHFEDTSVESPAVKPKESVVLSAQDSDVANQTFIVDASETQAQDLTSANNEALLANQCLTTLLSDSLQTMLAIYKRRGGQQEKKDVVSSWKSSAVGQRVASILNEVDKNLTPVKDKLPRPNILSLSSPTAYSDVFSSPEGSPSTPGSPAKTSTERLSFRPSSPVFGEHADDIQTPLDVSGLPDGEGESSLLQDLNPEQEWFDDNLGLGEGQINDGNDEAGNYYQIYPYQQYYYIREIPNKPPPPYTPPNQSTGLDVAIASSEGSLPFSEDEKVAASLAVVPSADKELPKLVEEAASLIQREVADGCCAEEVNPPREFLEIARGDRERDRQDVLLATSRKSFRRFVFDLTKEMLSEAQTTAREPPRPPWMRPKWLSRRRGSTLPREPQACIGALQRRVTQLVAPVTPAAATTASTIRLRRKKRDRVDEILVQELREDELDWVTYDEDEVAVKLQLADSIFDCLLLETGQLVASVEQRRRHRLLKQKPVR